MEGYSGYSGRVRRVQWRGAVEGYGGRGPVGAVEGYAGYCGGVQWATAREHTHTMLKTLKMRHRRIHVCDFIAAITFAQTASFRNCSL